jgi:hypothetical protein
MNVTIDFLFLGFAPPLFSFDNIFISYLMAKAAFRGYGGAPPCPPL